MDGKTIVKMLFEVQYDSDAKIFTTTLASPGILEDVKHMQLPAFLKFADVFPDAIGHTLRPMQIMDIRERLRAALLKAEPDYRALFKDLNKPEAKARLQFLIDLNIDAQAAEDCMHYEEIYNRLIR
jgi:hypothetical protein